MKITWRSHQIGLNWSLRVHLFPQVKKEMVSLFTPCFLWKDKRIVSNNFENWVEGTDVFKLASSWTHHRYINHSRNAQIQHKKAKDVLTWTSLSLFSWASWSPRDWNRLANAEEKVVKNQLFCNLICNLFKPATCCEANLVSPSRYSKLSRKENPSQLVSSCWLSITIRQWCMSKRAG